MQVEANDAAEAETLANAAEEFPPAPSGDAALSESSEGDAEDEDTLAADGEGDQVERSADAAEPPRTQGTGADTDASGSGLAGRPDTGRQRAGVRSAAFWPCSRRVVSTVVVRRACVADFSMPRLCFCNRGVGGTTQLSGTRQQLLTCIPGLTCHHFAGAAAVRPRATPPRRRRATRSVRGGAAPPSADAARQRAGGPP